MMLSSPWKHGAGIRPASVRCPGPSAVCAISPAGGVGFGGLVFIIHMSSTPVFSVPSTLRSPSSPIHEEDEEKLSQDSDAPPPLSGAGLALSSSPEVRPFCHPVPTACVWASRRGAKCARAPLTTRSRGHLRWVPHLWGASFFGELYEQSRSGGRSSPRALPRRAQPAPATELQAHSPCFLELRHGGGGRGVSAEAR